MNIKFSFSLIGWLTKAKEPSFPSTLREVAVLGNQLVYFWYWKKVILIYENKSKDKKY